MWVLGFRSRNLSSLRLRGQTICAEDNPFCRLRRAFLVRDADSHASCLCFSILRSSSWKTCRDLHAGAVFDERFGNVATLPCAILARDRKIRQHRDAEVFFEKSENLIFSEGPKAGLPSQTAR